MHLDAFSCFQTGDTVHIVNIWHEPDVHGLLLSGSLYHQLLLQELLPETRVWFLEVLLGGRKPSSVPNQTFWRVPPRCSVTC